MTIAVISDTHGLLRPEVLRKVQDCDIVLHAGDVGSEAVLRELELIRNVIAVRGNVDRDGWANRLQKTAFLEYGGKHIVIVHDIMTLDIDPPAAGIDIVIYGHSHQPSIKYTDGILYLNPGSAGPRRFNLPVSMALLDSTASTVAPRLVDLL